MTTESVIYTTLAIPAVITALRLTLDAYDRVSLRLTEQGETW
jgi:hypothetical protein